MRHNHILHPTNGNAITVTVTEDYTYGGTGGRVELTRLTGEQAESMKKECSLFDFHGKMLS